MFLKNEAPENAEKNGMFSSYKIGKTLFIVGVPTKPKRANTLFLKIKDSWQLSSHYGRLEESKDLLRLWDDVKLKQKRGTSNTPLSTLTTSTLDIHLKEKTAQTSAPIVITQISQEIHAIGLHADFNSKTIRLLSQVKGQLKSAKK